MIMIKRRVVSIALQRVERGRFLAPAADAVNHRETVVETHRRRRRRRRSCCWRGVGSTRRRRDVVCIVSEIPLQ